MSLTLHGKKILITREKKQAGEFSEKVLQYGGIPVEVPLLQVSCKDNLENEQICKQSQQYKWIFFTSANGVACFFQLARKYNWIYDILSESKFAAVGHKTAECLKEHGYQADFIPSIYNAEIMVREFFVNYSRVEEPVLLVRGNRSRDVLPVWFSEQGIAFVEMEVYETMYNFSAESELNQALKQDKPDFITFTSPSIVEAFFEMKQNKIEFSPVFVCIGTTTSARAADFGISQPLMPEDFTIDGMLDEISNYLNERG